ncbi:hypothetical protein BU24DRAFT_194158 [Aaosphaeria arxii CBS 175.79]|uniref:Mid2 domain-containing protein n=1 Tax=Aaosphaeria arxii CBS 175.79 TaxID=1450172 RepID=A0A6A5XTS6_9PLEO|nr:uncharacterized protein BU24DRAFT_194158 [Aaosphaeria arxii CBS 175.79]KAF2016121.1 hypothetical protein BU24DRAFT_194158 [Aaosphaeria arxii CBS 175.79]
MKFGKMEVIACVFGFSVVAQCHSGYPSAAGGNNQVLELRDEASALDVPPHDTSTVYSVTVMPTSEETISVRECTTLLTLGGTPTLLVDICPTSTASDMAPLTTSVTEPLGTIFVTVTDITTVHPVKTIEIPISTKVGSDSITTVVHTSVVMSIVTASPKNSTEPAASISTGGTPQPTMTGMYPIANITLSAGNSSESNGTVSLTQVTGYSLPTTATTNSSNDNSLWEVETAKSSGFDFTPTTTLRPSINGSGVINSTGSPNHTKSDDGDKRNAGTGLLIGIGSAVGCFLVLGFAIFLVAL